MIVLVAWLVGVVVLWYPIYQWILRSEGLSLRNPDNAAVFLYATVSFMFVLIWPVVGLFTGTFQLSRFISRLLPRRRDVNDG